MITYNYFELTLNKIVEFFNFKKIKFYAHYFLYEIIFS